jgi:hypothetical protein
VLIETKGKHNFMAGMYKFSGKYRSHFKLSALAGLQEECSITSTIKYLAST